MPLEIEVDPGKHIIRVEKEGYLPIEQEIEVKAGEVKELTFTLTPIVKKFVITALEAPDEVFTDETFTVKATVKNVGNVETSGEIKIYLDDTLVDSATIPSTAPGAAREVTAKVKAPSEAGTVTLKVDVLVNREVTDSKSKTIVVKTKKAKIIITTEPTGAKVYIDGRLVGET